MGKQRHYISRYFSDFVTRIHKNDVMGDELTEIAYCPFDARYPDGDYVVMAELFDIQNNRFESEEVEFTIDNFQPFIQSAHAHAFS